MNIIPLRAYCVLILSLPLAPVLAGTATPSGSIIDGYWSRNSGDYPAYLRIRHDSGFSCVLDDKSSYPFTVKGDSMTTPMNGRVKLVWFPGSGDVQIEGEEKGVPFYERYRPIDSAAYWAKCREEEAKFRPSGILAVRPGRSGLPDRKMMGRNLLGRRLPWRGLM